MVLRSDIEILDTATWKYVSSPYLWPVHGVAPSRRDEAVSGLISGHFVVALGKPIYMLPYSYSDFLL